MRSPQGPTYSIFLGGADKYSVYNSNKALPRCHPFYIVTLERKLFVSFIDKIILEFHAVVFSMVHALFYEIAVLLLFTLFLQSNSCF